MIEIKNFKEINKGVVKYGFWIYIPTWGITIRDCVLMHKGENTWVSYPSRKYESEGQTKYFDLVVLDKEVKYKLNAAVIDKIKLIVNAESNNEEVKKPTLDITNEEIPF